MMENFFVEAFFISELQLFSLDAIVPSVAAIVAAKQLRRARARELCSALSAIELLLHCSAASAV